MVTVHKVNINWFHTYAYDSCFPITYPQGIHSLAAHGDPVTMHICISGSDEGGRLTEVETSSSNYK